jgi:hypothetical protein
MHDGCAAGAESLRCIVVVLVLVPGTTEGIRLSVSKGLRSLALDLWIALVWLIIINVNQWMG